MENKMTTKKIVTNNSVLTFDLDTCHELGMCLIHGP